MVFFMDYRTNTSYGTWNNHINPHTNSPEEDIADAVTGADPEWCQRMEQAGAFDTIATEYRQAINDELPPSISLCGNEFIGPAHPDDTEFDTYPTTMHSEIDLQAIIDTIDLQHIIDRNELLTLEEIGRSKLHSQSRYPERVASSTMRRLNVNPCAHQPHPVSHRTQNLYRTGDVDHALNNRRGKGWRANHTQ